jgi:hypothetical protein
LRFFPVEASFFREYKRNWPDFNFLIMPVVDAWVRGFVAFLGRGLELIVIARAVGSHQELRQREGD